MIYDTIAAMYDRINSDIDYKQWADFIEKIFDRECGKAPELLLDLGCGTGRMTLELASRGYDMTGIDYSAEMLNYARESEEHMQEHKSVLWLCQDMCEFELYGTVDAAVSCLDTVNHITSPKELRRCFSLVHNYLMPDGLFIFDINGKRKFEEIYGTEAYVYEHENELCVWQNYYNDKTRICDFYISLFKESEDGRYERYDSMQRERMYTLRSMRTALTDCGFEYIGAYSDFDFAEADDASERIYIVAKCKK